MLVSSSFVLELVLLCFRTLLGFKVVVSLRGMVFLLITWKAVVLDEYNYALRIGLQRR